MLGKSQIPFSEYFKLNAVSGGKKDIHSELNYSNYESMWKKMGPYLLNPELAICSKK